MSLRVRVIAGLGIVAAVMALLGMRSVRSTEASLIAQVDATLTRSVPRLRTTRGPDGSTLSPLWVAALVDGEYRVLMEPDLTRSDPGSPNLSPTRALEHLGQGPFTVPSSEGSSSYRVDVRAQGSRGRTLVVAAPLEDVENAVRHSRNQELMKSLVVSGLMALVAFWVDRLGLRPIRTMTDTATAIAQGDRSKRIPAGATGTEAGELGEALNQMLTHLDDQASALEASQEQLKQFVADASHELRTPLATVAGYSELYEMGGLKGDGELDEAMRRVRQETDRMTGLVHEMLTLARLDQAPRLELAPLHLGQVLSDAARDARAVEPQRPISVEIDDELVVEADEARIRQVIANLIGNVRTHTEPTTPLHLRLTCEDEWAIIEVSDDGPGMDPQTTQRAFERFYRADSSRGRATGGSGLGLSIVAATIEAHGGHVRIVSELGVGTRVQVALRAAHHIAG